MGSGHFRKDSDTSVQKGVPSVLTGIIAQDRER